MKSMESDSMWMFLVGLLMIPSAGVCMIVIKWQKSAGKKSENIKKAINIIFPILAFVLLVVFAASEKIVMIFDDGVSSGIMVVCVLVLVVYLYGFMALIRKKYFSNRSMHFIPLASDKKEIGTQYEHYAAQRLIQMGYKMLS